MVEGIRAIAPGGNSTTRPSFLNRSDFYHRESVYIHTLFSCLKEVIYIHIEFLPSFGKIFILGHLALISRRRCPISPSLLAYVIFTFVSIVS
jgi:hypothetical protein